MEVRPSTSTMIVPETLTENNYKTWSAHMKSYLSSRGLWDVVLGKVSSGPSSSRELTRENAAALQAIQISCGKEAFRAIDTTSSAKDAWEILLKLYAGHPFQEKEEAPLPQDSELLRRESAVLLINAITEEDSALVEGSLVGDERWGKIISRNGYTALHAAISIASEDFVDKLIKKMSQQQLEIRDRKRRTALALAAYQGKERTVRGLIGQHRDLFYLKDDEGNIPLLAACQGGHVELTRFLWDELMKDLNQPNDEETNGLSDEVTSFLQASIQSKMFDVAIKAVLSFPRVFGKLWAPYLSLSEIPSAFLSGSQLVFWQRWIYNLVWLAQRAQGTRGLAFRELACRELANIFKREVPSEEAFCAIIDALGCGPVRQGQGLKALFNKMNSLIFPQTRVVKHIYELKLTHAYAFETLQILCRDLSTLEHSAIVNSGAVKAMFNAIKNGIVEFVIEIIRSNPDIIWVREERTSSDILMCAIAYRQEKIASFIYGLDKRREATVNLDKDRNNLSHVAGKLAPDSQLSRISGAALQMQRELQWFKEVESIVPPYLKECKNDFRKTPGEVFSEEHKDLQRKAEDWMKQTASSYTVVGALIITVMFAVAFTIPGGNKDDTGFPIFLHETLFKIFIVSDAVSLSAASTSVLMFLGILTSRYAEKDFLVSLPRRLIIGLSTLFISIAVMMVAFSAAVIIMLKGQLWIIIVMVMLASIPVIFFAFLQFALLVEIFNSTYRWKVFEEKRC
ncbi:hypothetical protein SLE2022_129180 [Rubroshorea leprosula]